MEFSLFLLILTILFCLLYLAGEFVIRFAGKNRWFRFGLLLLPPVLFLITRTGAVLALAVVLLFIIERETGFSGKRRTIVLTVFFLAVLAVAGYFYNREIRNIWQALDRLKDGLQSAAPFLKNSRLGDVYPVAQYFRFAYPVLAAVLIFFLFDRELDKNRKSYWYRFFRNFNHGAVYPLVIFWTVYLVADRAVPAWFQPVWRTLTLELAVYFSLIYIVYGLLTIQVAMKRVRMPFIWTLAVLYLLVVISGPVFIFTLTVLMGIGVSDIWMHYRKKVNRG